MKLIIKKDQADEKGIFGGHKGIIFSLYAKADISSEEIKLIQKYKVGEYVLTTYKVNSDITLDVTVDQLTHGFKTTTKKISMLLELENNIKQGCKNLKDLLSVMSTFGGEKIIEI